MRNFALALFLSLGWTSSTATAGVLHLCAKADFRGPDPTAPKNNSPIKLREECRPVKEVSLGTTEDLGTAGEGDLQGQLDAVSAALLAHTCGDSRLEPLAGEECDDGNATTEDGCSSVCAVEEGWLCAAGPDSCESICGDGLIVGAEVCDDSNTADLDGCSANCRSDETCGNGYLDSSVGEECDPPSTFCLPDCTLLDSCGDLSGTYSAGPPAECSAVCGDVQWIVADDNNGSFSWVDNVPLLTGQVSYPSRSPGAEAAIACEGDPSICSWQFQTWKLLSCEPLSFVTSASNGTFARTFVKNP